ncbi:hypothetical protein B0H10DRAFT_2249482 [Mycena sp. CBHHK59/15]|nr:hypothetical protein B0H10DRAFT_2249482 [Mycena sp. CBHHK59/15]
MSSGSVSCLRLLWASPELSPTFAPANISEVLSHVRSARLVARVCTTASAAQVFSRQTRTRQSALQNALSNVSTPRRAASKSTSPKCTRVLATATPASPILRPLFFGQTGFLAADTPTSPLESPPEGRDRDVYPLLSFSVCPRDTQDTMRECDVVTLSLNSNSDSAPAHIDPTQYRCLDTDPRAQSTRDLQVRPPITISFSSLSFSSSFFSFSLSLSRFAFPPPLPAFYLRSHATRDAQPASAHSIASRSAAHREYCTPLWGKARMSHDRGQPASAARCAGDENASPQCLASKSRSGSVRAHTSVRNSSTPVLRAWRVRCCRARRAPRSVQYLNFLAAYHPDACAARLVFSGRTMDLLM